MNWKVRKVIKYLLVLLLICVVAYGMMNQWHKKQLENGTGQNVAELEEKQIESITAGLYPDNNSYTDDLTEDDEAFLQNYFYGIWQFEDRIVPLCETEYNHDTETDKQHPEWNFSETAQETLCTLGIDVNDTDVSITTMEPYELEGAEKMYLPSWGYYEFENPQDAYLYGMYGGYGYVHAPAYHVEKVNSQEVRVLNLSNGYQYETVDMSDEGITELYHIYYNFGSQPSEKSASYGGRLPSSFYIDVNHPNVLYVDFCGLWKLERKWKTGEIYHPTGGGEIYPLSDGGPRII